MPSKKNHARKIKTRNNLEEQHKKLVKAQGREPLPENYSLEQPYAYKIVQSVTTYGAYDRP